jgi:putative intracellular protease/amidase
VGVRRPADLQSVALPDEGKTMSKILFIMTAADQWTLADGTRHRTGFWADEAVVPYEMFTGAGHRVEVATPGAVPPPVDPASLSAQANGGEDNAARIARVVQTTPEFRAPLALHEVRPADYDAVYVPGGHGPMEDLAVDPDSGRILTEALHAGLPVGVVCHGPAALLAAVDRTGGNVYAGYRITAFTNAEESLAGTADRAPWLLQDRLTEAGLKVEVGPSFAPHVQVDRTVVTGQNPASAGPVAAKLLAML